MDPKATRSQTVYEYQEGPVPVDPSSSAVLVRADRAAAFKSTVLITGESGTGKELLARRIHRHGDRRQCAFVPVNCGGLPETLIETELFGYRKGAFTGAVSTTKGLIEEAEGGVLFLDEIGDMPLSMQVRLLRFLDSGEIRLVGDTNVKYVDVRVIAATNRCLDSEIRERRFREDLFFRLNIVSLHLPPLRECRADIPALVDYHTRGASIRLGVPLPEVSDKALSLLVNYSWPGNIRELKNVLEQALVESVGTITPKELSPMLRGTDAVITMPLSVGGADEQLAIALQRQHFNCRRTAAALGISRTTLWRRLKRLNASSEPQPNPS